MRQIDLYEHRRSDPLPLSAKEIKDLRSVLDSARLGIEPAEGTAGHCYHLKPSSTIGAFQVGDLSVSIRPKLAISQVLFLASYAMDEFKAPPGWPPQVPTSDLVQAMAYLLALAAQRAFARGLHRDYREHEEALTTVKGRIRVAEQIRRRFGVPIPVEVRYDDFTEDVTANRLVKAAAEALIQMRLRDRNDRTRLTQVLARLENVSWVEYERERVPDVRFNRLNEHYREVVALSRIVLQHRSIEAQRGDILAPGFLMDMNRVFESFVVRALRKELKLTERTFRSGQRLGQHIFLAKDEGIQLKPDLTWWERGECTFVGDAKYKRIDHDTPNADLYQMLAYATALDLPGGLLIYAQGTEAKTYAEAKTYEVRHCGKLLEVFALDLSGTRQELLDRVRALAERVRRLRSMARDQVVADKPTRAA